MPLLQADAPPLDNVEKWVNTAPINLEEGTYLLYFWNYGCLCCRNRLKLFRQIHQQYPDIKVIGVHTPQFGFEQDEKNLEKAVEKLDINHPVAHDIEGKISDDYGMAYSGQAVIVDEGTIVFQQTHRMSVEELVQKISDFVGTEKDIELPEISQVPPQKFFGYARTSGLNEEGNYPGEKEYQLPENRKKETTYLKGVWEQREHYIEARRDSEMHFSFNSSEISLLMDPNDGIRDIEVLIDGRPVAEEDAGEDLRVEDGKSYVRAKHPDLYSLFDASRQIYEVTLIPDKKTRLYALSFR